MKTKIILILTTLLFSFSYSQNTEKLVVYNFYKVNEGRMVSYENVMKHFISGIQKKMIEEGCKDGWVFRKVDPTTEMSNYISHYTIDIYENGQKPCDANWNDAFPNLPSELFDELMTTHQQNRKRIYVARLGEVAHYNKQNKPAQYSIVNLMRVNNLTKYSKKHRESTKGIFEKYTSRQLWVANNRLDPESYGAEEWNYLTVDGFSSKSEAMKGQNIPQKVVSDSNKKYGMNNEMRRINKRITSNLIMYLN